MPHSSQGERETVSDSHSPHIEISLRAELAPITRRSLQSVAQVVIDPEVALPCIDLRQTILLGVSRAEISHKPLLPTSHDLGVTECLLPEWNLAQPIRSLQPISAALQGTRIFRPHCKRKLRRLPREMKPE